MPMLNAVVSANANSGLWQEAQLTLESFDRILSLNNFSPNFSGVNAVSLMAMKANPVKAIINSNVILYLTRIKVHN